MITDSLSSLGRYRGMHPALDTAIQWLETHDLPACPMAAPPWTARMFSSM